MLTNKRLPITSSMTWKVELSRFPISGLSFALRPKATGDFLSGLRKILFSVNRARSS